MKIKDIKRKSGKISKEEAINFLYYLFEWYDGCFYSLDVSYCDDECKWRNVSFDSREKAIAFIDDLELEQLDVINCDFEEALYFSDSDIIRYSINFNHNWSRPLEYARIGIVPITFKNLDSEEMNKWILID